MSLLLQLLANGLVTGTIFALLACSFGLVYRSARIFHVAFAGLILIPPYVAWSAVHFLGLNLWMAVAGGVGAGILTGLIAELVLYRPLLRRRAGHMTVMVASLGAFVVIENLLAMIFGDSVRRLDQPIAPAIPLGPVSLSPVQLLQLGVGVLLLVGLGLLLRHTRALKVLWAMGDEPELVSVLGLPLERYRALLFMLSGGLGAFATCFIWLDVGIDPHVGMTHLLAAVVGMLAGGIDRYYGWIIGSIALAELQSLTVWGLSSAWSDFVSFAVLISILLFRPQGLLGLRRRVEET